MPSIDHILSFVRENVLKDQKGNKISQDDLADKLGLKRGAYLTYESGRSHGPVEFYEAYKTILGIDLLTSTKGDSIVIVDPTRYSPEQLLLLKKEGANISHIPIFTFDPKILPFPSQEKYPDPVLLVPRDMCLAGKFGIQIVDSSMEPGFIEDDYVFCGDLITTDNIEAGHIYLLAFDEESGPALQIGKAEKKGTGISLTKANNLSNPVIFSNNIIKGIYKVVGHYKGEAGINR